MLAATIIVVIIIIILSSCSLIQHVRDSMTQHYI